MCDITFFSIFRNISKYKTKSLLAQRVLCLLCQEAFYRDFIHLIFCLGDRRTFADLHKTADVHKKGISTHREDS